MKRQRLPLKKRLELLREQGFGCAVCGVPNEECIPGLFADYNESGRPIGLLCRKCKKLIDHMRDKPKFLEWVKTNILHNEGDA